MKTLCIHLPREDFSEADAIIATSWDVTKASIFQCLLDDMHDAIRDSIAFETYSTDQTVYLCFTGSGATIDIVTGAIYSMYPNSQIKEFPDYTYEVDSNTEVATAEMKLARSDIYPLLTYKNMKYDSMSPVASVLSTFPPEDRILIQVVCKPAIDNAWLNMDLRARQSTDSLAHIFRAKYWFKKGIADTFADKIREKCLRKLYRVNIRVAAMYQKTLPDSSSAQDRVYSSMKNSKDLKRYLEAVFGGFSYLNTGDLNDIKMGRVKYGLEHFEKFQKRESRGGFLLSTEELTTAWHPPSLGTLANTAQVLATKAAAPKNLPINRHDPSISIFAETDFRDIQVPFGILRADRRQHLYVLGKSGAGKSCLLQLLVKSDIENGFGCAVLDPHGDLVDDILRMVPEHRVEDVVLIDPSDINFPVCFNPLAKVPDELRMRVAVGFVEIFHKLFASNWNDRMEYILRYTILALLSTSGATILSMRKILTDERYRQQIANNVADEVVKQFWFHEFPDWAEKFGEEAITPLLEKVDQFIAPNMIRNMVGQPDNRIDFREIMDSRKILLMKVSKGALGDENSALLGAMLVAKIYQAAMSRADTPLEQREDFYLYVDEFHNFATATFKDILSEARKYRLNLTVANQFLGQLPGEIRESIFGNVGNLVSFGVGGADASQLANEFAPRFEEIDLINLRLRDFYIKMAIGGEVQEAFSGRTTDIYPPKKHFSADCIEHSRFEYARPVEEAMEILDRWATQGSDPARRSTNGYDGGYSGTLDLRQYLRRYGTILQLSYLDVMDEHLTQLKQEVFENVRNVQMLSTPVGDKGLEHLQQLPNIAVLRLDSTQITDAGIVHLQGLPKLRRLRLDDCQLGDAALNNLEGMGLTSLFLRGTQITDHGLRYLKDLPRLAEVNLKNTRVTQNGIKNLQAMLPKLRVAL